ncbi:MAG: hypothetical protein II685_04735, partial [Clostridia bacterium]|nr:hypothetical protein [Clostridia bacterium]
ALRNNAQRCAVGFLVGLHKIPDDLQLGYVCRNTDVIRETLCNMTKNVGRSLYGDDFKRLFNILT